MVHHRYPVCMEIAGDTAMWTSPESGDSPNSAPVPHLSAVRAMFESVLWGPDILIIPTKVEICKPIQYHSYVTNYYGPLRSSKSMKNGAPYQLYATVLIDVCYRLYADVIQNPAKEKLPVSALKWDAKTTSPGHAYQEIFNRRIKKGQSYASLCLGWKEFTPSYFGPFRQKTEVCADMPDIILPSLLREVFSEGYDSHYHVVYDTNLVIHQGTLIFPERRYCYD